LINLILEKTAEFWQMVKNRTPPNPEWGWDNENTLKGLRKIYKPTLGDRAALGDDVLMMAQQLVQVREKQAELKKKETELKSKMIFAMKESQAADLPGGWAIERKLVSVKGFEVAARVDERFNIVQPAAAGIKKRRGKPGSAS
jgi:hypothetical protein